jgi:hypothetical protein
LSIAFARSARVQPVDTVRAAIGDLSSRSVVGDVAQRSAPIWCGRYEPIEGTLVSGAEVDRSGNRPFDRSGFAKVVTESARVQLIEVQVASEALHSTL